MRLLRLAALLLFPLVLPARLQNPFIVKLDTIRRAIRLTQVDATGGELDRALLTR